MDSLFAFSFNLYHDTVGQSQGPAPSYASDPTGIYLLIAGILLIGGLMVYFHKQNQKEAERKNSSKRRK